MTVLDGSTWWFVEQWSDQQPIKYNNIAIDAIWLKQHDIDEMQHNTDQMQPDANQM